MLCPTLPAAFGRFNTCTYPGSVPAGLAEGAAAQMPSLCPATSGPLKLRLAVVAGRLQVGILLQLPLFLPWNQGLIVALPPKSSNPSTPTYNFDHFWA